MGVIAQREKNRKQNLLDTLKTRLKINTNYKDSVLSILAEVVGGEIERIENEIYDHFYKTSLSNAENIDLDEVGSSEYNISRLPATLANSNKFFFYVLTGSFGDINNSSDITIPSGTLISTSNSSTSNEVVYATTEEIVLSATNNNQSFYAEAQTLGSSQNITELSLQFHNFTNYIEYDENSLKVTNTETITNGSDEETDEFFRTRCAGQAQLQVERNKNYIYLTLLKETDVYDFEIIESFYGIGTIGVVVKGGGNGPVSDAVLNNLNDMIQDEAQHLGQFIGFTRAFKVNFRVEIDCTATNTNLTQIEKSNLELEIAERFFEILKEQEVTNFISFGAIESALKNEFSLVSSASNLTIISSIYTSVEDNNYGTPQEEELNPDANMTIARDQYVGTDITINVNVR